MNHKEIIAKEGLPITILLAAASGAFWTLGWRGAALLTTALAAFTLWFFRNPDRRTPEGERLVVAPADGRVVFVGEVDETKYLHARALKVSIFMSVFDVHVNRAPESGRVSEVRYNPGRFLSADLDKASEDNEQNAVVLETDGGRMVFVQIAGLIARRIVCWVRPGDSVRRGERFGLIMFGSRLDVYLPAGSAVRVKTDEKTRAGETVIGTLP